MPEDTRPELAPVEPELGDPIRLFRPSPGAVILLAICGIVVILMGVGLFIAGWWSFGVVPIVLGIVVLFLGFVLTRQRLLVCPGGVIHIRYGRRLWCRWEDMAEIRDTRVKSGIVSSRICTIAKKDGTRMWLQDTGIGDFGELIRLLREQGESRGIPVKEEQVTK